MKNAVALAAVAMTSLAACNANRRVGNMEATRNRPVAHLTEAAIRNHVRLKLRSFERRRGDLLWVRYRVRRGKAPLAGARR